MTVSKTVSPKASTRRAMTSRPCRVRASYMVASTPSTCSRGFSRSWTLSMVSTSSATARRAKNSQISGMMTPCAAVRALTVSRPERGLAVDQDDVVVVLDLLQRPVQHLFPGHLVDQLHFGGGEVDVGRQQVNVFDAGLVDGVADVHLAVHQDVVDREVQFVRVDAEAGGERTLGIEVDQQDAAAVFGKRRGQVDGGRGLPDAALLVDHGDNPRRAVGGQRRGFREVAVGAPGGAHDGVVQVEFGAFQSC